MGFHLITPSLLDHHVLLAYVCSCPYICALLSLFFPCDYDGGLYAIDNIYVSRVS